MAEDEGNARAKNLAELAEKAYELVGFTFKERKLSEDEISTIADYCEARNGSREYVEDVLRKRGRPFDISDQSFSRKCLLCKSLRNYCCC